MMLDMQRSADAPAHLHRYPVGSRMDTGRLRPTDRAERERGVDPLLEQRVLGDYVVKSLLGAGGMASVYLAEDPDIGRIAIKVLHEEFSHRKDMAARFVGEARAASAIGNPYIVKFVAKGRLPDGRVFLAMEYLDGEPFDSCLKSWGVVSPERAIALLGMACWALHDAHEKGIVHRDIKPGNLFWLKDGPGEFGALKVLDFGIAKIDDARLAGGVVTGTGTVLGTPKYMSPEQATGLRVDFRSDIYSVAVVAHLMLTGLVPQPELGSRGGWRDPREFRPELPPLLAAALLEGLEFRPEERPSSMRAWMRLVRNSHPRGVELLRTYAYGFNFDAADASEDTDQDHARLISAAAARSRRSGEGARAAAPTVGGRPRRGKGPRTPTAIRQSLRTRSYVLRGRPRRRRALSARGLLVTAMATAIAALLYLHSFRAPAAPAPRGSPTGTLQVDVTPWAIVEMKGKRLGESPLQINVPVGRHQLTVSNDRQTQTITVTIEANRTTSVEGHW
jgi:serine/threonine protein kinase